jgi:hypothetical protein
MVVELPEWLSVFEYYVFVSGDDLTSSRIDTYDDNSLVPHE